MRLIIRPVQELGNRVFTSADVVTGLVYLDVTNTLSISEIVFTVKARLHCAETACAALTGAESVAGPCFYTLFESSQVLFPRPPLDKSTRYALGKGRHEYHFGVDFSLLSRFAQAEICRDPTLRSSQIWEGRRIFYTICVAVKGCGLFRRQVRKSKYLVAVTLDPPSIPRLSPAKGLSRQAGQVLDLGAFELRKKRHRGDDQVPPPYLPAIMLRAGISNDDGLLYLGDPIPLRLWVMVPFMGRGQLKAVLKSVHLHMVDPTVVSHGRHRIVRPAGTLIREVRLDIPLQTKSKDETFEVDTASWKGCKVPQSLSIIKSAHESDQPYLLQVLCEFTCDRMAGSIFTSVLIPVGIATESAPPKYEALAHKYGHHIPDEGLPGYDMDRGA